MDEEREYTIAVKRYPNGRDQRGILIVDTVLARSLEEARRKARELRRARDRNPTKDE